MNKITMNETQKSLAVVIGTALYNFLKAEDFAQDALEKFKETYKGTLGRADTALVDIQAYDDIHLAFFQFAENLPMHLVAVGDFTCDAYTLFNHFTEESIAEYVSIWELEVYRNPILDFSKRINGYATVNINQVNKVFEQGEFSITLHSEDNEVKSYHITGLEGTITEGISIFTEIAKAGEFEIVSLSSVVSKHTSDEFTVVNEVEAVDDLYYQATSDLVERLLKA